MFIYRQKYVKANKAIVFLLVFIDIIAYKKYFFPL